MQAHLACPRVEVLDSRGKHVADLHREPLVPDKPAGARRREGMSSRILMLVGPEYKDLEVWYPKLRLEEAGFEVKLAGLGEAEYRGKHGYPCKVDGRIADFPAAALAGIIAPGGGAAGPV